MPYQNYAGVWLQDSAGANNWINGTIPTQTGTFTAGLPGKLMGKRVECNRLRV